MKVKTVSTTTTQFWLQEKRGGEWFDYAAKDTAETALARIQELKQEHPSREFRAIERTITDKVL